MARIVVTGSSGHLGEALMRLLRERADDAIGLDVLPGAFTDATGSITDGALVDELVAGADAVLHAATLHKPHVGTHSRRQFVDTNLTGTLTLLEAAARHRVGAFVFTSTTSAFGRSLTPGAGQPAVWVTETVPPTVRNVYGATKVAAEDLCELVHRDERLPVLVLRTSRFFPERDDQEAVAAAYDDANLKVCELLYRRVDLEDAARAHLLAVERAPDVGFGRYIISATTPLRREDAAELTRNAADVVARRVPGWQPVFDRLGWRMLPVIERVYDNRRARDELGWEPTVDFAEAVARLDRGQRPFSGLADAVGAKGYHEKPVGVYTARPRPAR
jgi:UDP-glucose 4-epimerase